MTNDEWGAFPEKVESNEVNGDLTASDLEEIRRRSLDVANGNTPGGVRVGQVELDMWLAKLERDVSCNALRRAKS